MGVARSPVSYDSRDDATAPPPIWLGLNTRQSPDPAGHGRQWEPFLLLPETGCTKPFLPGSLLKQHEMGKWLQAPLLPYHGAKETHLPWLGASARSFPCPCCWHTGHGQGGAATCSLHDDDGCPCLHPLSRPSQALYPGTLRYGVFTPYPRCFCTVADLKFYRLTRWQQSTNDHNWKMNQIASYNTVSTGEK